MAMVIGKFHRMIQSRLLWAGFLVIVVFAFVIWGMVTPRANRQAREATAAGSIDGRLVGYQEFRDAYLKTYLSLVMTLNRQPEIDAQLDRQLRLEAWKRLVELKTARRLGVGATDGEVVSTIRRDPHFVVEGQFSRPHYDAWLRLLAEGMGISERGFEEYVREEIILQKLRMLVTQAALVSPFEQQRAFRLLTDQFDIDYVVLSNELVADQVKLSEQEVRAYYEKDPEAFAIPPQVRVKYVALLVSNYLDQVTVTEEELLDYYEQHTDEFTVQASNNAAAVTNDTGETEAIASSNQPAEGSETNLLVKPFDEVKDEIARRLTWKKAREVAMDKATEFVVTLAPDRAGNQPEFDATAERFGLTVARPQPFTRDQVPPGVDAGEEFTRAAFELTKAPDEYFSDAIPGTNAVYVIALEEKLDRRVPPFEEVKEEVRRRAQEEALYKELLAVVEKLRETAQERLSADPEGGFARTARQMGLEVYAATNVTAASGVTNSAYSDLIMRAILVRSQGEITEPVPADGGFLLAYVRRRQPADPDLFSTYKQPIINALRRERGRMLWESWEEFLMQSVQMSNLVSRAAAERADEIPDEEEESPESPLEDQDAR